MSNQVMERDTIIIGGGQAGLYFLGLHWLHTLKSGLFLGVGEDAEHIAEHIAEEKLEMELTV